MDSEALQTFMAIHSARGFSSAADILGRSQPAISRRIALLEQELGVPLFERATGGVVLSEAGRTLLPHAERVHAALRDAANAMEALRTETAGGRQPDPGAQALCGRPSENRPLDQHCQQRGSQ